MKIFHIGEYANGGVATYLNNVVSYQEKSEEVDSVYLMISEFNSYKNFTLDEKNLFFYNYRRSPKFFINAIIEIHKKINLISPDIIHVHSTFAGVFVRFPYLFKKNRPKIVYCSHGWAFNMEINMFKRKIFSYVEKILSLKTELIINISHDEYKKSIEYNLPVKKSVVIYNGINESETLDVDKINLDLNSNFINLLFLGRFDRQKGLDILIDFFNNHQLENIKLYIIGESIISNDHFFIPDNIVNLGWIDNKLIDKYYKEFDAVIIPSRWEGFGLVAIEAMKNKKPLIVSNRGALPELVSPEKNGFVFQLEDLNTLKDILNKLDKEKLKCLGENGYLIFKNKFTSSKMNEKIIETYKTI